MTTTTTKPEALITTPAESAECPKCMRAYEADLAYYRSFGTPDGDREAEALRYPTCARFDGGSTFAHCEICGSTDLVDTRSPFEVLAEAKANVKADLGYRNLPVYAALSDEAVAQIEASVRMDRMDVVTRVQAVADLVTDEHLANCQDCKTWRARS